MEELITVVNCIFANIDVKFKLFSDPRINTFPVTLILKPAIKHSGQIRAHSLVSRLPPPPAVYVLSSSPYPQCI